ncbi:hypothetical protein [Amycolatopsis azurea]|nr:hypothetical protein [Amycolatopsis azurea]
MAELERHLATLGIDTIASTLYHPGSPQGRTYRHHVLAERPRRDQT